MTDLDGYERERWWANDEVGTTVYRLTKPGAPTLFLKTGRGLADEAERLRWASGRLPVPEVVAFRSGEPDDLVTLALPGGGHDRRREPDTARATRRLAEAWRLVHSLPVAECPFDTTTDTLPERAAMRTERLPAFEVWDPFSESYRTASDICRELTTTRPPPEAVVVVHGDASVPNALIADGVLIGIVDLGMLGRGDPWWDISACLGSMSRTDNALGHEGDTFFEAYGMEPDPERERWFRLLYRLQFDLPA